MNYFNTLPRILQPDPNGNSVLVTNLLSRAYLLPQLSKNVYLFYQYTIRDIDSPENVAYKYYNDVSRFWLVLYANNVIDPKKDWPVRDDVLTQYMQIKYKNDAANALNIPANTITPDQVIAYTQSTAHHYEETITTYDTTSTDKQVITINIDEDTYNNLIESTTDATFNNGITVSKIVSKSVVSIYNYEQNLNESKRNINLVKNGFASDAEQQLIKLMS